MLGYLGSSVVFLLLLATGATLWRGRLAGSFLIPAMAAQCVWSAALGLDASGIRVPFPALVAIEYLRSIAWAIALVRCLAGHADARMANRISVALAGLLLAALVAALIAVELAPPGLITPAVNRYWAWGGLALAVGGLILVEQAARNTRAGHEWALKHVWLAIGALFACDACVYSVALMNGRLLGTVWLARGAFNALLGGLLALGLRRVSGWRTAAFLSPRLVFFDTTLLGAGVYLLAMAAASYSVRKLGGTDGDVAQMVFLAVALLALIVAALSAQFRAHLRVALAKYVFPYRYDYRAVWQSLTRALCETDGAPAYDQAGRVMAAAVECGSFGIWRMDAESSLTPLAGDIAPPRGPPVPADAPFLEQLRREWIYDLELHRAGCAPPGVPPAPAWLLESTRVSLLVPLVAAGELRGLVALGRPLAQMRLTWEEIDLLRAAGRQIAGFLSLEQAAARLVEARQFEAFNRLSAFIMHDLRHLIAQQALLVENAARHRGDPQFFEDTTLTIEHYVRRMARLMEELRADCVAEGATQRIDAAALCAEVVRRCSGRQPIPALEAPERGMEVIAIPARMTHALEHIVRNAQEAAAAVFPRGTVALTVHRIDERVLIEIDDTGAGMHAEFIREHLFRPFDSTKGSRGMGLGAFQAREFARGCGGDLTVVSEPGRGSRFTFTLPLAPAPVAANRRLDELEIS